MHPAPSSLSPSLSHTTRSSLCTSSIWDMKDKGVEGAGGGARALESVTRRVVAAGWGTTACHPRRPNEVYDRAERNYYHLCWPRQVRDRKKRCRFGRGREDLVLGDMITHVRRRGRACALREKRGDRVTVLDEGFWTNGSVCVRHSTSSKQQWRDINSMRGWDTLLDFHMLLIAFFLLWDYHVVGICAVEPVMYGGPQIVGLAPWSKQQVWHH
jgi:hypothetical protein